MINNLVPAFSQLIQDELTVMMDRSNGVYQKSVTPISDDRFSLKITVEDTSHDPYEESLLKPRFAFMPNFRTHYFTVDIEFHAGITRPNLLPWEQVYKNKAHLSASLLYGDRPNQQLPNDEMILVCRRMLWMTDDPECQMRLAAKIYMAIQCFVMTKQQLPDH